MPRNTCTHMFTLRGGVVLDHPQTSADPLGERGNWGTWWKP